MYGDKTVEEPVLLMYSGLSLLKVLSPFFNVPEPVQTGAMPDHFFRIGRKQISHDKQERGQADKRKYLETEEFIHQSAHSSVLWSI
jgi:hypothetical protein